MDKEKAPVSFWRHDELGAATKTVNNSDKDYHPAAFRKKNIGINSWERWVNYQTQISKRKTDAEM